MSAGDDAKKTTGDRALNRKSRGGIKALAGAAVQSGFLAVALLGFMTLSAGAEVNILDVRTGRHPDKTRVVLEVSQTADYQISYRDNPKEILVDLRQTAGGEAAAALARRAEAIDLVEKLRIVDHQGGLRLHLGLRQPVIVDNILNLRPDHGKQYRLVLDLKAASAAQWRDLVGDSTPESVKPAPEGENMAAETTPVAPAAPVAPTTAPTAAPEYHAAEYQPAEDYDEGVTEDGNFTLSGYIEAEGRIFTQSSPHPEPDDWTMSFALEPLLEYVSDTSSSQVTFRPFGRVDVQDGDRSHFDIRELKWTASAGRWLFSAGIDTVFWGVTESNHLVDILNQDDNLEDIDQEDKLGQPMVSVSYNSGFGVFSAYLMTYFRERRFPGRDGRLRMPLPIDYARTQYQAGSDKWHADWALRWSHVIENIDVGLYHFRGTSRDPVFVAGVDTAGDPVLIPRYNLIDQSGLDLQATFEDLLIKFEAISWAGPGPNYWAMTGGFEYTFYDMFGDNSDISLLSEYLYDDRGSRATTPFEDDLFLGLRYAANDIDSSEVLVGAIFDLNSSAKFLNIEGSRRIGESWTVSLDARFFLGIPMTDPIFPQSRDDFFQLRLARYF